MNVDWKDNFEALYRERGQQKRGIRLLALWKIQAGITETEVCRFLGKTHNTIRLWRRLYETKGLEGLLAKPTGRGRKPHFLDQERLRKDIEVLQANRKGGRVRCADIIEMVSQQYDVTYSPSGMYHILKKFGFSWITSRSRHPKQDLLAQETFKKNLPSES